MKIYTVEFANAENYTSAIWDSYEEFDNIEADNAQEAISLAKDYLFAVSGLEVFELVENLLFRARERTVDHDGYDVFGEWQYEEQHECDLGQVVDLADVPDFDPEDVPF